MIDADFRPGSDEITFELASLSGKPTRIEVRLLYQTFSPRYLDELLGRATPEMYALRGMLDASALDPELVAEATANLP